MKCSNVDYFVNFIPKTRQKLITKGEIYAQYVYFNINEEFLLGYER